MNYKLFRWYLFPLTLFLVTVLLVFEFYAFLVMQRDMRHYSPAKTVRDHEAALCSYSMPEKLFKPSRPPSSIPCPSQGIVTAFRQGSLSVNIWLYANVLAISLATGLEGYVPYCLWEYLSKMFDNLTLPPLSEIGHCYVPLPDSVSSIEEWTEARQSIVIRATDLCNDVSVKHLGLLSSHFVFNRGLRNLAIMHLLRAKKNASSATYIGVYITRTEVVMNQEEDDVHPNVQFFVDAMNHFRKEYSNAVFVVIVDKKLFWKTILKESDVYMVEEKSMTALGGSLSVLAHCNHTVLASQDFPVWGAILSGGKVIVSLCMAEEFNILIREYQSWNYLLNSSQLIAKLEERVF